MTALADSIVTRRLVLRQPTERDLPQIVREIGNWEVAKWLARVPHPYVARGDSHDRQRRLDRRARESRFPARATARDPLQSCARAKSRCRLFCPPCDEICYAAQIQS